ncbi:MAG: hypothetical protein JWO08_1685 [Verrucomicrobiaceae bacterium]|nr:hypothetical protein [Verrucomicrobiaceae bacterium]
MHIQRHQYEPAYKLGLRVHDDKGFGLTKAFEQLPDTGLNPNTARIFISNVPLMLSGRVLQKGPEHSGHPGLSVMD